MIHLFDKRMVTSLGNGFIDPFTLDELTFFLLNKSSLSEKKDYMKYIKFNVAQKLLV